MFIKIRIGNIFNEASIFKKVNNHPQIFHIFRRKTSKKLLWVSRFNISKSRFEKSFLKLGVFPNDPSLGRRRITLHVKPAPLLPSPSGHPEIEPIFTWNVFSRGSTHARSSQIINTARRNKSIRQRGRPIVDRVVSFLTSVPPIVPWTIILPVESFLFLPLSLSFDPGYASSVHKLQRVSMIRKREQADRVLALNETRNCCLKKIQFKKEVKLWKRTN